MVGRKEHFSFARQAWFEWSAIQRGALMVEVEGPEGKKIAVLNIHTTAGWCCGEHACDFGFLDLIEASSI